jgi:choline kinase
MKAIILAAGEGTRLRPHTLDRPKCLVELFGTPLLSLQLGTMRACGIDDITLVTGYRADLLDALGYPTRHNPDYDSTNMVASLMCAADLLDGRDDVLIAYADIVYERKVLEPLLACTAPIAISVDLGWRRLWSVRSENPLDDAETLRLDENRDVIELGKKPKSIDEIEGQYMGLIKVAAEQAPELVRVHAGLDPAARYDGRDVPNMFMTSFLQHLIDTGHPVRAAPFEGGWLEVDTTEDLEIYEAMQRQGNLRELYRPARPAF